MWWGSPGEYNFRVVTCDEVASADRLPTSRRADDDGVRGWSRSRGGRSDPRGRPLHLAFPVRDIDEARRFYGEILGCPEGRSAPRWVDYNFWGHQLVCHLVEGHDASASSNAVDGDPVPVPHFGLAMTAEAFDALVERVTGKVDFVIAPHVRFEDAGEQRTMFFKDPSGNALEFKTMANPANLFARYNV